tara:strand:+ start:186 stop:467 length:282 start_codon:yes stop_codon:yes gene_type:complete
MTVQELMERAGITETGRAVFYIKEALHEVAITSETHIATERIDIVADKRFYEFPVDAIKILDIRCKNHNNGSDEFRSIPRSVYEPFTKDSDGN